MKKKKSLNLVNYWKIFKIKLQSSAKTLFKYKKIFKYLYALNINNEHRISSRKGKQNICTS